LAEQLGAPVMLEFEVGEGQGESAHAKDLAIQQARQQAAEQAVEQDPFVKSLLRDFDGRVVPGSVQPGPSLQ
jgi:DNA polymerase-3 subunit gamma/tau